MPAGADTPRCVVHVLTVCWASAMSVALRCQNCTGKASYARCGDDTLRHIGVDVSSGCVTLSGAPQPRAAPATCTCVVTTRRVLANTDVAADLVKVTESLRLAVLPATVSGRKCVSNVL